MRRILVVDDEFPIREWLTHVIRNNRPQYEVCSAQNGLDALEQMQMQLFDLIISDIRMPQLDGIGLFEQVNRLHPAPELSCLAVMMIICMCDPPSSTLPWTTFSRRK